MGKKQAQSPHSPSENRTTIRVLFKKYCQDTAKDWDEGVPLVLFAVRETIQESLGFSPAELVFRHQVRERYDKQAVARPFQPGDEVLVLLPVPGASLSARFFGPHVVKKKMSETDYVLYTPDRKRKTRVCHLNMLKAYHTRESPTASVEEQTAGPAVTSVAIAVDLTSSPGISGVDTDGVVLRHAFQQCARLGNSEILEDLHSYLNHLTVDQRKDIIKRSVMRQEVKYLLKNGLAKSSCSPWSSPCLLVPKPDGTFRFYTDYHKVNAVTVSDIYPLPQMEDCVDNISSARFVTKLDMLKGYWQVPLTSQASEISAFVTPDNFLQYTEVGQGQVRPVEAKVTAIVEYPVPTTHRELQRFLGMGGYYRSFCKNFSTVHFEVYLGSSSLPIVVYTDHNPLVFLTRMYNHNQRLMHWALIAQNYNLEIRHKKGSENVKDTEKNIRDIVTLPDDDVKVAEEVLQLFKPLKTVTTLLSTESAPSGSMILPLKTRILQSMFKSLTYIEPALREKTYIDLTSETVATEEGQATEPTPTGADTEPNASPPQKKSAMEELFGDTFVKESETDKSFSNTIKEEVASYSLPVDGGNPLAWWKHNECKYPHIAKMARHYLAVPATSVPSERVFSTAGDIVTAKRSTFSPENEICILPWRSIHSIHRGLARVFRCCCTQGPLCHGTGMKNTWRDRILGARDLCKEAHGVEVVGVLVSHCILNLPGR
ncbi:Transposon Ty3-I Gag-Pol polyprotein [Labeo rohita]|uniref:ribonuclease H n=1 Tax=Labeo rohita TaxID=84645 RepID=A0ABQ8MMQ2_LABRO|nr:Transposon Ty3-I Gag-Pol polyprotein [Labeo rohita]